MNMRDLINIVAQPLREGAGEPLAAIASKRGEWLPGLIRSMDQASIEAIFETQFEDEAECADAWFDNCLSIFRRLSRLNQVEIYRHMKVVDFDDFIQAIESGEAGLGEHWSINHAIESPTWEENHRGSVEVLLQANIAPSRLKWANMMQQWFEWPHEYEVIFDGDVNLTRVTNMDEDETYKPRQTMYHR